MSQAGIHLPGMPGLMGSNGDIHMLGNAAMMMAAAHAHNSGSSPPGSGPVGRGNIKLGRGVVDPAAYKHKLFIGQIPYEVRAGGRQGGRAGGRVCVWVGGWLRACGRLRACGSTSPAPPFADYPRAPRPPSPPPAPPALQAIEQDLWQLFAPLGDVLELAILRSQGRSKGCAFLTYASRQQVRAARGGHGT